MHPAIVRLVFDLIPATVLVTDAIDATGVGDGHFELGGQEVLVQAGEARLSATGSLAGSTLTMDQALRNAVKTQRPQRRARLRGGVADACPRTRTRS